jgi:hypothetical protein
MLHHVTLEKKIKIYLFNIFLYICKIVRFDIIELKKIKAIQRRNKVEAVAILSGFLI